MMFRTSVVGKRRKSGDKDNMNTEIVTCGGVPVAVYSWGDTTPSKILKNPENKPKELILVVPGNPGLGRFYFKFAGKLHQNTNLPVWIIGHGGHERIPVPRLNKNPDLYTLDGQTKQKQDLIQSYLKGVKLRVIGHSVGSYMTVQLLKNEQCNQIIHSAYLLFPTLEKLVESPNGQKFIILLKYLYWIMLGLAAIFDLFPLFAKILIMRVLCFITQIHHSNAEAFVQLFNFHSVKQVLFLVEDEFKTLRNRDNETLRKNSSKIKYYYGTSDMWVPLEYYRKLKEEIPEAQAEVCTRGIKHSFVLNSAFIMADLISEWITNN